MKFCKLTTLTTIFILLISTNAYSAKVNVPTDFPNSFEMEVISGFAYLDNPVEGWGAGLTLNSTGMPIGFDASAFNGIGVGEGSSAITTNSFDNYNIASGIFFGLPFDLSLYGNGNGSLVDNDNGSGEWSLSIGTKVDWLNGITFDLGQLNFTTDAYASYYDENYLLQTVSGSAMDYETGDAFFIAQSDIITGTGLIDGMRLTIGISGNDPVVNAVPVPTAVWLFGSGLIGLVGFSKRKKA